VSLRTTDFKPAVEESPDSPFIVACAAAVTARTGRAPGIKGVSYYSDGAILLDGIKAPFAILGPGDLGMSGQPDETASADAIRDCTDIYVQIAEDWLA